MRIVVAGSIAYDYLMRFPGRFTDHLIPDKLETVSLSFLVDSMVRQRGGVAPNIAYTLRLLGGNPIIFGTVGQDFGDYRAWLEKHGISTEHIIEIEDDFTASFFVSTDQAQNQIANFYTGAMAHSKRFALKDRGLTDADMVVVSPSDPEAMMNLASEARDTGIPFLYDPSQQTARLSGEDLKKSIPGAAYLFVNEYELAVILKKTGWTVDRLRDAVEHLVVTEGEKGSTIHSRVGETRIPTARPDTIVEPTGAGDAYRGGFLAALSADLPHEIAGRVGALCSTYVLEQLGTANHRFDMDQFSERYESNFGHEPGLDRLRERVTATAAS
ncbi:MAG: carbohydrate kinase family protein [Rhodothermales bacterium]|nr:carbohydrate kinase family protein [Rhodothermales bacterium]MBO6779753.1 carbohydrate kinase family protein [Rhodothermales bacterium]